MRATSESGRNIIASMLPADVRLIRSWQGHPLCMVQDLDESFDAVLCTQVLEHLESVGRPARHRRGLPELDSPRSARMLPA